MSKDNVTDLQTHPTFVEARERRKDVLYFERTRYFLLGTLAATIFWAVLHIFGMGMGQ